MNRFSEYEQFSHGSSGVIFRVKLHGQKEMRCLKRVPLKDMQQFQKERLDREIQYLKELQHPNIIGYIDHFSDENHKYIITEYADQGDLDSFLDEGKILPEIEVLRIASQVLSGLAYLHSKGIVHRDLKAENIFLFKNGLVKLGDLGLSKGSERGSLVATAVGTSCLMAPEVIQELPYLYEVDSWGLGCLLYRMMSGKLPFEGRGFIARKKVLEENPSPLTGYYSPELLTLVGDLLQKNPMERLTISVALQSPIFAQAFVALGLKFQQGIGCDPDISLSLHFYKHAYRSANSRGPGWIHESISEANQKLRTLKLKADVGQPDDHYDYALNLLHGLEHPKLGSPEAQDSFQKALQSEDPYIMYICGLTERYVDNPTPDELAGAAKWFEKAADSGDARAMVEYGLLLQSGFKGTPPNFEEAMKYFKKAARAGHPQGMALYGRFLENGYGGSPPRKREAMFWYRRSAEADCSMGKEFLGHILINGFEGFEPRVQESLYWLEQSKGETDVSEEVKTLGDVSDTVATVKEKSMLLLRKAASQGDAISMVNLGICLDRGDDGKPPRKSEARTWFQKASDAGDLKGMLHYGLAMESHYKNDASKLAIVMKLFKKAAESGYFEAFIHYSRALEKGYGGVPPQLEEAKKFLDKFKEAQKPKNTQDYDINLIYSSDVESELVKPMASVQVLTSDPELSATYLTVGQILERDSQVNRKPEAFIWYKKSSDMENPEGMYRYALGLQNGDDGNPPRVSEAQALFKKSAELGNSDAMAQYGFSEAASQRFKEAKDWFKKAADQGSTIGMAYYGFAIENSYDGTSANKDEALIWYKKAMALGDSTAAYFYNLSVSSSKA